MKKTVCLNCGKKLKKVRGCLVEAYSKLVIRSDSPDSIFLGYECCDCVKVWAEQLADDMCKLDD